MFNKPVTGVSLASFSLTSGGGPNLLTSAQTLTTSDNITYTLGNLGPLTNSDGNYSLSLVASPSITDSSGGYLASGAATTFIIDLTPPEVQGVFVSGIDWNSSFLTYLETSGLGTAQSGYQIPAGATQLSPLPWSNVTTLTIAFTEDVSIDAANAGLALIGSPDLPPPPSLAGAAFSYSHVTHTATWTLDSPLPENKYLLSIPAAAVMDALGSQLDGEWTNPNGSPDASQFPSGNGTAGGDFNFRFNVLPADVNQDGAVTGSDGNTLRNHLLEDTSSGSYSAFSDLNADGAITGLDGAIVRMNLLQSLPASDPQAPAGGNQALAVSGQATESANSARLVQPVGSAAPPSSAASRSAAALATSAVSITVSPVAISILSLPTSTSPSATPISIRIDGVQPTIPTFAHAASIRRGALLVTDSTIPTTVAKHALPRVSRSATAADDLRVQLHDLIFEQLGQWRHSPPESFL